MIQKKELYIGIDLGYERAMVSLYHAGMKEPETISTVPGEEKYQIPTAIFVGKQGNYYGDEAIRRENRPDGEFYDNLFAHALQEKEATLYHSLLVQFIRRLIRLKERYDFEGLIPCLALTVPEITTDVVELFGYVREELEFPAEQAVLMDYGESFFAHTFHQESSIWMHDVVLFDFSGDNIQFILLHRNGNGKIQIVSPVKRSWQVPAAALGNPEFRDEFFANVLREAFMKRIISGVYFIGDGFDGGWLRESLRVMGPNKRVFLGKNLYTRGACMAAFRRENQMGWNYFYDCSYKMQGEVNMKVQEGEEITFLCLTEAGRNWFEPVNEYYLIYDRNPKFEVWIRARGQLNTKIRTFELDDIPERPAKTIRLKVRAVPQSGNSVLLEISDDGFGELFESSGKVWTFLLDIGN